MPRYKLTLEYDGSQYNGWQEQDVDPSVQTAIQEAVFSFCGQPAKVVGAGRTDSGVHAIAQVAHVDLPRDYEAFSVMQGINFYLFAEEENRIAILNAELVDEEFHARFSATKRHYFYRIINRRARLGLEAGRAWHVIDPLNEVLMQEAANLLIGTHDFTSFRDTQCQAKSPIKTLDALEVVRRGDEIHITTSARSFLHHQVRIMAGTLAMVGRGKWTVDDVRRALDAKERAAAGITAVAEGLYLVQVDY